VTPASLVLDFPFHGRWLARNSPARRIPSHGTHLLGTTYAIDFIPVDEAGRSAALTWRTLVSVEPPERFHGFGAPIVAPGSGEVVLAHDGEPDHEARRSALTLLPYALGQAQRVRAGAAAIAGNHVVLSLGENGPFVLLAHLRRGSVRVKAGDALDSGDHIGGCGNSGNSTQPHVHVQATDSIDWPAARGLPIAFRRRGVDDGAGAGAPWIPNESEIVDAG